MATYKRNDIVELKNGKTVIIELVDYQQYFVREIDIVKLNWIKENEIANKRNDTPKT